MKALVVYGTRYGTAEEIAQEIARIIREEGTEVDLKDAKDSKKLDVTPYDLIIIGSGIKMGKWTKQSLKFLKKNKDILKDRKVALFVSCGAANEEKVGKWDGMTTLKKWLQKIWKQNPWPWDFLEVIITLMPKEGSCIR
jgi:menaquinone-dependent protoporphyrinogen IX oxidase